MIRPTRWCCSILSHTNFVFLKNGMKAAFSPSSFGHLSRDQLLSAFFISLPPQNQKVLFKKMDSNWCEVIKLTREPAKLSIKTHSFQMRIISISPSLTYSLMLPSEGHVIAIRSLSQFLHSCSAIPFSFYPLLPSPPDTPLSPTLQPAKI